MREGALREGRLRYREDVVDGRQIRGCGMSLQGRHAIVPIVLRKRARV